MNTNTLMLTDIRKSESYVCQSQSTLGIITRHVEVRVRALPRPPVAVRISDITATSIRIVWEKPTGPQDIQYYIIEYKPSVVDRDYSRITGLVTTFYSMTSESSLPSTPCPSSFHFQFPIELRNSYFNDFDIFHAKSSSIP